MSHTQHVLSKPLLLYLLFSVIGWQLLCGDTAHARKRRKRRIRRTVPWLVGAQIGLNFAFSEAVPKKEGSTRQGLILGVHAEKKIYRFLYFQPEFRYVQKGVTTTINILSFDLTGTVKLDALQVPLLVKAKFGNLRFNPYVFVGPVVAVALRRDIELVNLATQSLSAMFKWYDFGLDIGGGGEFLVARNFIGFLSLRYHLGLLDLNKSADSYKTRGIEIILGIKTIL